jgi:hypothetical protein
MAGVVAAIVTAGSGVLSWDALRWGAGQLGIDPNLTWLYPVVADGMIAAATVGAVATRAQHARTRVYVWLLLGSGIGISVVGNAAHASGGAELYGPITLHRLGSAVPALALAATLHLLVIIVRATGSPTSAPHGADVEPPITGTDVEPVAGEEPDRDPNRTPRVPARATVRQLLQRHGDGLTAERVAERTGVSIRHARKLLRGERGRVDAGRRPRLLEVEAAEPAAATEEAEQMDDARALR